ncbi:MAG: metal-sulfur cluster assembly factor [Actinomycetota bacterium]
MSPQELGARDVPETVAKGDAHDKVEAIRRALDEVMDPELGISIVDLGLLYGVTVDEEGFATLDLTLTSAGCPLTFLIEEDTSRAMSAIPGISGHRINWVWDPPWSPERMTEDGREQLRAMGFMV